MATTQHTTLVSPTEALGKRLLHDLETTEESLESLLASLRKASNPNPSRTGLPALDALWKAHSPLSKLTLSSRGLPLIYHLISTLVSSPHNGTVVVIDLDRRFSPSHLASLSTQELQHVHVFRPTTSNLAATMAGVEAYMLYGEHGSKDREWKGVFINGGDAAATAGAGGVSMGNVKGTDVVVQTAWKGWLKVEREEVGTFAEGMAVEEAWAERERRQEVVDAKGWRGFSEIGEFNWR